MSAPTADADASNADARLEGLDDAVADAAAETEVADVAPASLQARLEAVLFVAGEALPIDRLARLTGAPPETVAAALARLEERYADGGVRLRLLAGGYRFATAPATRATVEAYLLPPKSSLSPAALETLAVIAYAQPATRADVEAVRGVGVDGVVASLVQRGLIAEAGRKEVVGRPTLYATTPRFLEAFGLGSLADLPALPEEQVGRLAVETASAPILEGTIAPDAHADDPASPASDRRSPEVSAMPQTTLAPAPLAVNDPLPSEPDPMQPIDPGVPTEPVEPIPAPTMDVAGTAG